MRGPSRANYLGLLGAAAAALAAVVAPDTGRANDAKPVRSLLDMRNAQVVRQQWDLTCGAAAIATLMTYQLGRPMTEREAALGMLRAGDVRLVRARLGFSLLDLKRLAAAYGYQAAGYGGLTFDELIGLAPVVAPIRVFGFGHFVVVRGRLGDRVLVADPAFGNRTMTTEAFGRAWPSHVGFVVKPPGEPWPPNRMGAPAELFLMPGGEALRTAEAHLRDLGRR
jgi:predicted double-glycine peptidase